MTITEIILSVAFGVLTVVATFISYYFYVRKKAQEAAEGAIDYAEPEQDDGKTGAEKLEIATEQVYAIIPAILKGIITKNVIRTVVQSAFDRIERYAKKQVAKKSGNSSEKEGLTAVS